MDRFDQHRDRVAGTAIALSAREPHKPRMVRISDGGIDLAILV